MEPNTETPRKVGRPTIYKEPMSRVTITLSDSQIESLRLIGKGNLSKGVRLMMNELMMDETTAFAIHKARRALAALPL